MDTTSKTWNLKAADVQIDGEKFWNCDVEVNINNHFNRGGVYCQKEVTGLISFTHPVPGSLFMEDDGMPKGLDVVAETEDVSIEIDAMFIQPPCNNSIEFVAKCADRTVDGENGEDKNELVRGLQDNEMKEQTTATLASLIEDIQTGEIRLHELEISCDPEHTRHSGWVKGPTTLSVVYDDS